MAEQTNQAHIKDLKPAEAQLPAVLAAPMVVSTGYELQVASNAALSKAAVEARYVIAMRQPRNDMEVRQKILAECERPAFANNTSAYYIKPIGEGAEGLGVRFAEVAIRHMKNVLVESAMLYEDAEKEIHRVTVTDLEANATYWTDVRMSKYVERRRVDEGQQVFSTRKNSNGYKVYTVLGTEDDLLNKRGALISKALRTLALRLIPGDVQDEAERIIKQVRADKAAKDPKAEQKAIADGFFDVGVPVDELIEFLGHPLDTCSPPELVKLRGIFSAIREGDASWAQTVEAGWSYAPKKKDAKKPPADATKAGSDAPKGPSDATKPPAGETKAPTVETVAEKGEGKAHTDASVVKPGGPTPPAEGDLLGGTPAEPKPRPARKRGSIE